MYRYYRLQIDSFLESSLDWERKERIFRRMMEMDETNMEAFNGVETIKGYRRALKHGKSYLTQLQREVLDAIPYSCKEGKRLKDIAAKYDRNIKDLYILRENAVMQLKSLLEKDFPIYVLNEFYDFELKEFFRDSRRWDNEIRYHQFQIVNLLELDSPNSDATGVRSTLTSDMTGQSATKIVSLCSEIERINFYKEVIKWIIKSLSQEEYDIICVYYGNLGVVNRQSDFLKMKNDSAGYRKDRLCEKYYFSERTADRKKNTLDSKIKEKVTERFFNEYQEKVG